MKLSDLFIVAVAIMFLSSMAGCNQFKRLQEPSRDECEAAFEHVLKVVAKDQEEDTLIQEVGVLVVDWLAQKAGTKERLVKQCRVKATRYDTACILDARTAEELETCEFMKEWE